MAKTNNTHVNNLKVKYDQYFDMRIKEYIEDKGFNNRTIEYLKNSYSSRSYKEMISSAKVFIGKGDINVKKEKSFSHNAKDVSYSISWTYLLDSYAKNDLETKILCKTLTQSYIAQTVSLISATRKQLGAQKSFDGDGKRSLLVNKMSRILLDIVYEYHNYMMVLDSEDIHKTYMRLLESSDEYTKSAMAQLNSLTTSSKLLVETRNSFETALKDDFTAVDKLNTILDESISSLSATVKTLGDAIKRDAEESILSLKKKFILFSRCSAPLQYQLEFAKASDSNADFYKMLSEKIFGYCVDIYTEELIKNNSLKELSAFNDDCISQLFSSLSEVLNKVPDPSFSSISEANIEVNIDKNDEVDSGSQTLSDKAINNFEMRNNKIQTTDDQISKRNKYIDNLRQFMNSEGNNKKEKYSAEKIKELVEKEEYSENFYIRLLIYNIVSFISQVSNILLTQYGTGRLNQYDDYEQAIQQLRVMTSFSGDIISTLDQPMDKESIQTQYSAVVSQINDYEKFKDKVIKNFDKYKQLPDEINKITDVFEGIAKDLSKSNDNIKELRDNTKEIQEAINKQYREISNQALVLSKTLENIKSSIKDVEKISTEKFESLRAVSPNLQDSETRAQYYVLNALSETHSQTVANVTRDIDGLRSRAYNFVKMTAVMNFIIKEGLIGRTSLQLFYINEDTEEKQIISYMNPDHFQFNDGFYLKKPKGAKIESDYGSIDGDFPGFIQYFYLKAVHETYEQKKDSFNSKYSSSSFDNIFREKEPSNNYINFMLSYYYLQILLPFMDEKFVNNGTFKRYIFILTIMESVFLKWIQYVQQALEHNSHFEHMKKTYQACMEDTMNDMPRAHLELNKNLTMIESTTSGVKRAYAWVTELFVKDSSVGKSFKNYSVAPEHIEEFNNIFVSKYNKQIENGITVNLPLVLLIATDLSINSINNKSVDMIKTIFWGAFTGGIASIIGLSKTKSVLAGLTASSVYALGSWTCNSFENYFSVNKQRVTKNKEYLSDVDCKEGIN